MRSPCNPYSLRLLLVLFCGGAASPAETVPAAKARSGSTTVPSTTVPSTTIPMDSWVYRALDRLAALGFARSQVAGLRPWTRGECRRQMKEAETRLTGEDPEVQSLLKALHQEFDGEEALAVDSITLRGGGIAGSVLNDSYHFGQTRRDDFGRPFGTGSIWNAGVTFRAEHGRFFTAGRGEFQRAPGAEGYTEAVRQTIGRLDNTPPPPVRSTLDITRYRPMEAYAGVRLGNITVSVGKQSLYWGPGPEAPLSFSNNAEPTANLKISSTSPVHLSGFLRHLGAIRGEFVIGKLAGHTNTSRPWFNAQKLSFKLTENLEMGFTRWSIFWGTGHPITFGSFARNFASLTSAAASSLVDARDAGDRKAGFDFRYRIPGVRRWLTLYCDSYSDDDPSPLAAPRRAAMSPGIWLTRVPGVPKLDLRVDVASTTPFSGDYGGQYNYFNAQYRSGNTNSGFLLGNAVGRDARAVTARASYSFSPRSYLDMEYRQQKTGGAFLPGGGTQTDASVRATKKIRPEWYATGSLQVERFWIPVLGGAKRNVGLSMQLTWEPKFEALRARK